MANDRIELLRQALSANPEDAFLRYALALELSQTGELGEAWHCFTHLLEHQPNYSPTYYQAGLLLARMGRNAEAIATLERGIEVVQREGNRHAQDKLEEAIAQLKSS